MKKIIIILVSIIFALYISGIIFNKSEVGYEDNLNGKSLDWYGKEYYTVRDKMDSKVVLQRVATVKTMELGKEHFEEVWSSMEKGDEVVIFYHPQTSEMIKALVIVP